MITSQKAQKIATLARLKFNESELIALASQLSSIEHLLTQLQEVNCDHIKPLTSVNDVHLSLRDDEVLDANLHTEIFANIPGKSAKLAKEIKCFIVPKVVE